MNGQVNWVDGWRVPCVMRLPRTIEPGRAINDICSLLDLIPTVAAANGSILMVWVYHGREAR